MVESNTCQILIVYTHIMTASDASSEHSIGSHSVGGDSISTRNTLLAASGTARASQRRSVPTSISLPGRLEQTLSTLDTEEDSTVAEDLWKQPNKA